MNLLDCEVDVVRGFLPAADPLDRLPEAFGEWEEMSARVPSLMMAGRARAVLDTLGLVAPEPLLERRQLWRAYMVLSVMANGYIMDGEGQSGTLPRTLAAPLVQVATALGMPPVFTYASMVLHNWSRIDPDGPIDLGNVVSSRTFLGGTDEQWFWLTMVSIEARGAAAVAEIPHIQDCVVRDDPEGVLAGLVAVSQAQIAMLEGLHRVYEKCDPYIFFTRIRPVLVSWNPPGVVFEGVSDEPVMLIAASAAQSSLVQVLDELLGIDHGQEAGRFLHAMRAYMPPGHRRFLSAVADGPSLREYVCRVGQPELIEAYNESVRLLHGFRRKHTEITVRYVVKPSGDEAAVYGTSGNDLVSLLRQTRQATAARFIPSP